MGSDCRDGDSPDVQPPHVQPPHVQPPNVHGLPGRLVQVAYRVGDLAAGCRRWASTMGAGPFLVREHLPVQATYHGAPAVYDHSAAFGQWGPLMLELITVHDAGPAPLAEALMHDQPGQLHHVACFVDDLDLSSAMLQEQGAPLLFELTSSSGMHVRFHDGRELLGGLIELYVANEHLQAHYDAVGELAAGWDGRHPVRDMAGNPL